MTYKLGKTSLARLEGVDERMVAIVKYAIAISTQDFSVIEGVRTRERQAKLVKSGASRTMKSKHLNGMAVDVAAYDCDIGTIRWEEALYGPIAEAMAEGARAVLGVDGGLCWGGGWAVEGHEYPYDCRHWDGDMLKCNKAYHDLRRSQGRQGFNDMPHFELID